MIERHRMIIEFNVLNNIDNIEIIYNFLMELCHILDMSLLIPPILVKVPWKNEEDYGITGFMAWQQSGVQIHTWPKENNLVCLDIFSCKEFSEEKVINIINKQFNPTTISVGNKRDINRIIFEYY